MKGDGVASVVRRLWKQQGLGRDWTAEGESSKDGGRMLRAFQAKRPDCWPAGAWHAETVSYIYCVGSYRIRCLR